MTDRYLFDQVDCPRCGFIRLLNCASHISFHKGCILNYSCIIPSGLRKKRCFKMERHLEQDNAFHINDLAFCLTAYNTCIIIMRLLIHHGEYKAFVVPCPRYGMFKVFSQAFLSEWWG